ncbi:ATP-grasp domain-containing protein [Burkholderia ubonensis]|uniref:ATP-grasp domain-containing protein n=1 Tax=Burkholderia ubonensis TaxID=101571 RepID=UPI0009B33928|nr:ATP-grasp domain-containing protein [Burkholderia ubonensis]
MHIVLVETPFVRGFDCVAEMADAGIEVSFVAQNLAAHAAVQDAAQMARAARLIEVPELGEDIDLCAALSGRLGPNRPDGVNCRRGSFAPDVARLTSGLGVPGETRATALLLGDKRAVRQRLRDAGLDPLRWRDADTFEGVRAAARALGYPVVITPASGSVSLAARIARDESALADAWNEAVRAAAVVVGGPPVMLVEECLTGLRVSAELLVQDGEPTLLGMAERDAAPVDAATEIGSCFPAEFPGVAAAADFAKRVVKALGITTSAVHLDISMTPRGPSLIEASSCVIGHVGLQQLSLSLGRSVTMELVALATGRKISPPGKPVATAVLRHVGSDCDGIVVRVRPPAAVHPHVALQGLFVGEGSRVEAMRRRSDHFGYVLASGADRGDAASVATRAAAQLLGRLQIVRVEQAVEWADDRQTQVASDATNGDAGHAAGPTERTHVLLMDRVGPDSWTTLDGRPLLPPERFRTTVFSSSAEAGTRGARPDLLVRMDIFDNPAVAMAAGAIHSASPVHRVGAASERALLPAAALRRRFGAPGVAAEELHRFIDKAEMKARARRAGIRCADGLVVQTPNALLEMLERHAKVVVKPRALSGSQGVAVLRSAEEADEWLASSYEPEAFLAEAFVEGDMCHIDALVYDGDVLWDTSRYVRDTMAYLRGEPLSSVSVGDVSLREAAGALLAQVIDGWEVRRAVLHLEAFVTPTGLTFCEVAARPGGAGVVDAFVATRGVNLMHAKLLIECGEDPLRNRVEPIAAHSAWTVHYTTGGVLECFDDSAVSGGAYKRRVAAQPGDEVPRSRFSGTGLSLHVFAGPTHEEVLAWVRKAESQVTFKTRPSM